MSEAEVERFIILEPSALPVVEGHLVPPFWTFGIGHASTDVEIVWIFELDATSTPPRGYLDSVRQRHRQCRGLKGVRCLLHERTGETTLLVAAMPDGESLPAYLARVPWLAETTALGLLADLVILLRSLIDTPRLLANVEIGDFFVYARDGIVPALAFCPTFAILREETARSDYRIARDWTERLASLHSYVKNGRKGRPLSSPPGENKSFRPLFKLLETGCDRSLDDRLAEIEILLRGDAVEKECSFPLPFDRRSFPIGPLARLLLQRACESDPDRFATENPNAPTFSAFRVETNPQGESAARLYHLLPPEAWFDTSLVDPLNRRLSHPFLKAHHNCLRVRSVYFDESFTLLTGDPVVGIPLPSLLAARDGISTEGLILVAGKLDGALAQFESAGYDSTLFSPWQVELHLESGVASPGWEKLLDTGIATWPPWEVIVRVERPSESFLPGESTTAWRWVRSKLADKFFPALVAWMLDWKRFQWAARSGTLANEPLSWDVRLVALFRAAAEHLDPARAPQREKFLALIEEGLVPD